MNKFCMYCNHPIKGRADKKFCDDNCRNIYNNQLNCDSTNRMRNINNRLRKNRRILSEFNPDGKTPVSKFMLIEKGFHFSYHTKSIESGNGEISYFCYEFGYQPIDDNRILLLVDKNEEIN